MRSRIAAWRLRHRAGGCRAGSRFYLPSCQARRLGWCSDSPRHCQPGGVRAGGHRGLRWTRPGPWPTGAPGPRQPDAACQCLPSAGLKCGGNERPRAPGPDGLIIRLALCFKSWRLQDRSSPPTRSAPKSGPPPPYHFRRGTESDTRSVSFAVTRERHRMYRACILCIECTERA